MPGAGNAGDQRAETAAGAMIIRIMRMKIWLNGWMTLAYQARVAGSCVLIQ
jgi:hypothetical protein